MYPVEVREINHSQLSGTLTAIDEGFIFIDAIDSACLLILDEQPNYEQIYTVSTFRVFGIMDKVTTLQDPSSNAIDAFYSTYGIKDNAPLYQNLRAIAQIVQLSLVFFGFLDIKYCDGILCENTHCAIKSFLESLHNDGNKESKTWSLVSIKLLIAKVISLKKRLAKVQLHCFELIQAWVSDQEGCVCVS